MLPLESLFGWLNLAGIGVFAASGALAAARQRLDIVGACFFAIVTATGGGTLRDLLIDASVFWMIDPRPVVLCCMVAILVWGVPLRWWPERALEWLDAAGLAAFSVYGAGKALQAGFPPVPAIAAAGIPVLEHSAAESTDHGGRLRVLGTLPGAIHGICGATFRNLLATF